MNDAMQTTDLAEPRTPAAKRLLSPGKKRILTLDGGGVRGIVTVAFLKEMEHQLRAATGRKDLVLADVFDMIAGTSVGSMLGTMLALGYDVETVEAKFKDLVPKIFTGRETLLKVRRFKTKPLADGVRDVVQDLTLGSAQLKTGLCIIAKRVDTGAVWALSNNPEMRYFKDGPTWRGNMHYALVNLICASTAAPFLFTPTYIVIHQEEGKVLEDGWFVDGAVSPHNNPSLQMFLMAALPSYKLNWTLAPDQLLMISVGTGLYRSKVDPTEKALTSGLFRFMMGSTYKRDIEGAIFAAKAMRSIIADNVLFMLKMMQAMSSPRFSWIINSEIDGLEGDVFASVPEANDPSFKRGLLRFQRYDLPLEAKGLIDPAFDISASASERDNVKVLDDPSKVEPLQRMAEEAAKKQVSIADFEGFL